MSEPYYVHPLPKMDEEPEEKSKEEGASPQEDVTLPPDVKVLPQVATQFKPSTIRNLYGVKHGNPFPVGSKQYADWNQAHKSRQRRQNAYNLRTKPVEGFIPEKVLLEDPDYAILTRNMTDREREYAKACILHSNQTEALLAVVPEMTHQSASRTARTDNLGNSPHVRNLIEYLHLKWDRYRRDKELDHRGPVDLEEIIKRLETVWRLATDPKQIMEGAKLLIKLKGLDGEPPDSGALGGIEIPDLLPSMDELTDQENSHGNGIPSELHED